MAKWKSQIYSFANNLVAAASFTVLIMIATQLYQHYGPAWTHQVVMTFIAGGVALSMFLSFRASLALPSAREKITPENVGQKILEWLHRYNFEVQRISGEGEFFTFKVVTEGRAVLGISRTNNNFRDQLTFQAHIPTNDVDRKDFSEFTEYERAQAVLQLKIELSRAIMGYRTDGFFDQELIIFKHLPISEFLNEDSVINAIWDMEAMINTVVCSGALALSYHREDRGIPATRVLAE